MDRSEDQVLIERRKVELGQFGEDGGSLSGIGVHQGGPASQLSPRVCVVRQGDGSPMLQGHLLQGNAGGLTDTRIDAPQVNPQ